MTIKLMGLTCFVHLGPRCPIQPSSLHLLLCDVLRRPSSSTRERKQTRSIRLVVVYLRCIDSPFHCIRMEFRGKGQVHDVHIPLLYFARLDSNRVLHNGRRLCHIWTPLLGDRCWDSSIPDCPNALYSPWYLLRLSKEQILERSLS